MRMLKRSKKLPKESSIRFIVDGDGHVYGCVGLAGELLQAKIVMLEITPELYMQDKWLAVRTIGHHDVTECDTRENALEKFKEDENEV